MAGRRRKLGNKFSFVVADRRLPGNSFPGILDMLDGLPMSYRWSSRFIFLEQHEAVAALQPLPLEVAAENSRFWSQVFKSQKGMINTDALKMAQETEVAINDAKSGLVAYGYYTPVVVLMHEDRISCPNRPADVKRELERSGFAARERDVSTRWKWVGSLPDRPTRTCAVLAHTLNLADLLPLASVWPGLRENPVRSVLRPVAAARCTR